MNIIIPLTITLILLLVLLLILIINLLTFPRLTRQAHTPTETNAIPFDNGVGTSFSASARALSREINETSSSVSNGNMEITADKSVRGRAETGPYDEGGGPTPMVSVLIPARNEEVCIEQCVSSLVAQTYEALEVLVLDDGSSDATPRIVQGLIDQLPPGQQGRLRLSPGAPLPRGWTGKNFACYQLARRSIGQYLFFTDADTVHAPETVQAVIECMQQADVQLLTAQPEQVLGSLTEMLVVPLLNFTILTLLPVALISRRPEPSLATGNGQLLCFRREAYQRIGGHEKVKGRILEDVLLARATKAAGYRMAFVDAQELVRCRMYHSFAEVWAGFSKNLFAFYNYSLPFALVGLLLNLGLFVLPTILLLLAPLFHFSPIVIALAASAYLLAVVMRILLSIRFARSHRLVSLLFCFLHPLSILLECLILLNSIRWRYRQSGTSWKGRTY